MLLRTATSLARKGIAVFPCWPQSKLPATGHGCKDATTDLAIIRQWWCAEPNYNVAIATGTASRIFVVDVDGMDAETELHKLEAAHGLLPPSVEVITARGRHVYFQWPDCAICNSASKIAPGIDVRGNGGYVLAPPSIHPSGRRYEWSVDTVNSFAEAPQWLLDRIVSPNNKGNRHAATPVADWRTLARGVDEGQRNDSICRLAGYLLRHRIDAVVTLEILTAWNLARCRPPLDADEVASIVDSIAARELKRRGT
jgi:hypothetical protein